MKKHESAGVSDIIDRFQLVQLFLKLAPVFSENWHAE